jgi:hypothetical protein
MPTIDGDYYGQENPRDQIRVMLGSIRGGLSNFENGTISKERLLEHLQGDLDRLEKLVQQVDRIDSWAPPTPVYLAHSPYPSAGSGPRWRGLEKCSSLYFDSPEEAQAYIDSDLGGSSAWCVVEVRLTTPAVGEPLCVIG